MLVFCYNFVDFLKLVFFVIMFIKSLSLQNFRNYENETIEFSDGINILCGANAQGKTNCAEAIFFLCTGFSPRANKDRLLVRQGQENAQIEGTTDTQYGGVNIRIELNKQDKKSIYINGIAIKKVGELLGNIHSVFFNPAELKLVQESPEDRRRFMNVSLSQMSKTYFYALLRYNKILSQRNNLLKDPDKYLIRETLPIWDEQLSKEAGKIIKARNDFLAEISPIAQEKHATLSGGKEKLIMSTESGYYGGEDEIAYALKQDLALALEKDMRLGFTSLGPHRDDIKFLLNDLDSRVYGSQGQQRTIALSLKLAETELFKNRFNEYPILILDDVLSELDKSRQRKLVELVAGIQTIFTCTHFDRTVFKQNQINKITIVNGRKRKSK